MSTNPPSKRFYSGLMRRPVFLFTLFVTFLVLGGIAYERIPVQMMPDGIVQPGLQIMCTNPGGTAHENEEQVARVLEEELRTLPRIVDIFSRSTSDAVMIEVEFRPDTDMNFAKAEVRDRIERSRAKLPKTVRDIGIWSWSQSNMPIGFFALLHPGDSERTDFLVENVIKRGLESVDGVGKVEIWGTLDDSLRVLLDEDRVRAANLDLGKLIQRLGKDNFAMPLGEVEDGGRRVLLRCDMRFKSRDEIASYPIGDGLTIADVGRVLAVKSVRERLFRIDGQYGYFGEIQKDGQANTVEACKRVKAAIAELEKDPRLRGEFHFLLLFDQGEFIEGSLASLQETAVIGGALAIVILFLFLWRVRLTLLVALSIPFSALLAIAFAYFSGGTFNVLTMTGITLAMGMLIDNSIVVVENVTRLCALGRSKLEACVEGTGEVGLAVLLSTLATVVVFVPLIFMSGDPRMQIMFGELGKPLCISLLASLVAALVFLPVQLSFALGDRPAFVERLARLGKPVVGLPARVLGAMARFLGAVGRRLVAALASVQGPCVRLVARLRWPLVALLVLLAAWRIFGLLPQVATVESSAPFRLPVSWPDPMTIAGVLGSAAVLAVILLLVGVPHWSRISRRELAPPSAAPVRAGAHGIVDYVVAFNHALVEWSLKQRFWAALIAILAMLSIVIPITQTKIAAFGEDESTSRINFQIELEDNFTLGQAEEEMTRYETLIQSKKTEYGFNRLANRFNQTGGRLTLYWDQPQKREQIEAISVDLRRLLPSFAGHKVRFLDDESARNARARSVAVFRLRGPDSEVLDRLGAEAVKALEAVPGLSSVRSPLSAAPPQINVRLDDALATQLDVTARAAFENISWALHGAQLPRYQEADREMPLIIEYDDAQAAGLGTLRELEIFSGSSTVPLSAFANLEFGQGSRSIVRRNGEASFEIQARVDQPSMQHEAIAAGLRSLHAIEMPRGYSVAEDDLASSKQEEEFRSLWSALLLANVLVYLLMCILFESFIVPFAVMFTVPYAMLGSYWTLYVSGTAMDSIGWIGIIILVGVVCSHGIVLIDRMLQLRRQGFGRNQAVLEGCANRVRPVLMTSLTAVIALIPLATKEPDGESIDYRALATCVAGGLSVSTIFTLWVVPLVYTLLDDLGTEFSKRLRWSLRTKSEAQAAALDATPDA